MSVLDLVTAAGSSLSDAERRVAEAVLAEPQAVAFGTVAGLAQRANAGAATVVRLAAKLGFEGYGGLQAAVRGELTDTLRPAATRIREAPPADVVARTLEAESANLRATLHATKPDVFEKAVRLLSRRSGRVLVASGDSLTGLAGLFSDHLGMLRERVHHAVGSPVRVARDLATARAGDTFLVLDFRRYDRWLLDAVEGPVSKGTDLIALTDSPLSPLARHAAATFTIAGSSPGPFDSQVGALALLNALLAGVGARLQAAATERLARIEAAWLDADLLHGG